MLLLFGDGCRCGARFATAFLFECGGAVRSWQVEFGEHTWESVHDLNSER